MLQGILSNAQRSPLEKLTPAQSLSLLTETSRAVEKFAVRSCYTRIPPVISGFGAG